MKLIIIFCFIFLNNLSSQELKKNNQYLNFTGYVYSSKVLNFSVTIKKNFNKKINFDTLIINSAFNTVINLKSVTVLCHSIELINKDFSIILEQKIKEDNKAFFIDYLKTINLDCNFNHTIVNGMLKYEAEDIKEEVEIDFVVGY